MVRGFGYVHIQNKAIQKPNKTIQTLILPVGGNGSVGGSFCAAISATHLVTLSALNSLINFAHAVHGDMMTSVSMLGFLIAISFPAIASPCERVSQSFVRSISFSRLVAPSRISFSCCSPANAVDLRGYSLCVSQAAPLD